VRSRGCAGDARVVVRRLFALLVLVAACTHPSADSTPDGAVRQWLDRMEASSDDPHAIREAYDLLGPKARATLEERAKRTSQLQGRRFEPWQMLAAGRFGMRFRPKSMKALVADNHATVQIFGDEPDSERASVPCVFEGAAWRVEPELPPMFTLPPRE
jgi:hypothetical protein